MRHAWLERQLAELEAGGLLRDPLDSAAHCAEAPGGEGWLDACSNDYLGLGARTVSRETMDSVGRSPVGAGASRLVQGTHPEHLALEAELASWLGSETGLLTTSGFAANVGLLPALAGQGALIVSDALNHASIVDGCRLARGRTVVTPHLSLSAVEEALHTQAAQGPAWVVTEGIFSMDGDSPDLPALRALCDRYEAGLVVDESHSFGVLGPGGGGACAEAGIQADVVVAGLGKAVGAQGAVIACSAALRTWLWNRARSFVFSTGASPALTQLTLSQVRAARAADGLRARLATLGDALRRRLVERRFELPTHSTGPIIPVVLGTNERAMSAMNGLRARGVLAQAIRPPTVPAGTARLRLTAHANWPDDAVERLVNALEAACGS